MLYEDMKQAYQKKYQEKGSHIIMEKRDDMSRKGKISPAAAALTGLAVGMAAGVTISALSDKEKREKVSRKMGEMSDAAKEKYDKAASQAEKAWETHGPKIKKALKGGNGKVETAADQARDAARDTSQKVGEVSDEIRVNLDQEEE